MKLGWSIHLKNDDFTTLLEKGEVSTKFGTVALREVEENGEKYGYVSIQFDETQMMPKQIMQDWLDGFYEGNFDKLLEATKTMRAIQREKLIPKIIEG
jgi:hypothetical protein